MANLWSYFKVINYFIQNLQLKLKSSNVWGNHSDDTRGVLPWFTIYEMTKLVEKSLILASSVWNKHFFNKQNIPIISRVYYFGVLTEMILNSVLWKNHY